MALKALLVLLLLGTSVLNAYALTEGEKAALSAFLESWPLLGSQSPPWNSSVALACSTPPFYGVQCSYGNDTHVTSLYEASSFCRSTFPPNVAFLVVFIDL